MDAWECVYFIFSLDPEANQVQMYHKSPADNFAAIFVYITDMSPGVTQQLLLHNASQKCPFRIQGSN